MSLYFKLTSSLFRSIYPPWERAKDEPSTPVPEGSSFDGLTEEQFDALTEEQFDALT